MNIIINRAKLYFSYLFLSLLGLWLAFALGLCFYTVALELMGKEDTLQDMANKFAWKFDGTFKNSPGNIWYNEKRISIGAVSNKVQIGSLAGNRNLEFGIKSVLEEVIQDKGYDIDPSSKNNIEVDVVYLDVLKTQSSFSVMHKDKESVVIRLQGRLFKDGEKKPSKKILVEESADEVSMSTLAIDQGGKFNQTNLSSALKKATVSLVNKLLD